MQLHAISLLGPPIMDKGYLFLEIVKLGHLGDHLGVISFVGWTRKFLFGFSSVALVSVLWALSLVWLCSSFLTSFNSLHLCVTILLVFKQL